MAQAQDNFAVLEKCLSDIPGLPSQAAQSCVLLRADQQEPVSCFPDSFRKDKVYLSLQGFCFPGDTASQEHAPWEYHNFVITGEDGKRQYGHCLRFDTGRVGKRHALCLLSLFAFFTAFRKWLLHVATEMFYSSDASSRSTRIRIEPRLMNLVMEAVAIRSNSIQCGISLQRAVSATKVKGSDTMDIFFPVARSADCFPPLDFSLKYLFSTLDIYNVISAVEAILFGEQVVILSSNVALLTLASESLLSLIWPLTWPFSYVPLFANDLPQELVTTFLPFLFGIPKNHPSLPDGPSLIKANSRLIVIDLDENHVYNNQKFRKNGLPARQRTLLVERLKQITKPDLLNCGSADPVNVHVDSNRYECGIREAFFHLLLDLFEHIDFRSRNAPLDKPEDLPHVRALKAYVGNWQSESAVLQFFMSNLPNSKDSLLLSLLEDPILSRSSDTFIRAFGTHKLNFIIPEPHIEKTESKSSEAEVQPFDLRLIAQPRIETIATQLDKVSTNEKQELIDFLCLRVYLYIKDHKPIKIIPTLKKLARLDPHHSLLEAKEFFMALFSVLPPKDVEAYSKEGDKLGEWARVFFQQARRQNSTEVSTESLGIFNFIDVTEDMAGPALIEVIRKRLADLNVIKQGMTAVMSAADFGKPKMTFALLCYDANMNLPGTTGTLIHYVVSPRRKVRNEMQYVLWLRVLALMLARGEDIDRRDVQLSTPLIKVCQRPHPTIVRFLLQNAADAHVADVDKNVAMSCLTKDKPRLDLGEIESFAALLECGTNPFVGEKPDKLEAFDKVLQGVSFLQNAVKESHLLIRLQTLQSFLTTKREAFEKIAKNVPKHLPPIRPSFRSLKLNTELFSEAQYNIYEAQFQHLIKLHVLVHRYMEALSRQKKNFNRKEMPLVEHFLSLHKTLKEILVGHTTLFGEIRKVSTLSGSARSIAVVFQPFMSYFNSFYPTFVTSFYDGIMPDQLGKAIAEHENVKSLLDEIAISQAREVSDTFFPLLVSGCSITKLLEEISEFPQQLEMLFEDLLLKMDKETEEYGQVSPLCSQLESLRNNVHLIKQTKVTTKISGLDDNHDLKKGGFLVHYGPLQKVSIYTGEQERTEFGKQDFDNKVCYLYSMDIQKGCLLVCTEEVQGGLVVHVKEAAYYLKDIVAFDVPTFQYADGRESTNHMFHLVLLGGKYDKHDVLLFNAPTRELKTKWISLLWRLSIEGQSYSRNMGKYYLHKKQAPQSSNFEGYLDYRVDAPSIPWRSHYFVMRKDQLYAYSSHSDLSEPILIIRLFEYEFTTDSPIQSVMKPRQFYLPRYLFKFGNVPKTMHKPDLMSSWRTVLTNYYVPATVTTTLAKTAATRAATVAAGGADTPKVPSSPSTIEKTLVGSSSLSIIEAASADGTPIKDPSIIRSN